MPFYLRRILEYLIKCSNALSELICLITRCLYAGDAGTVDSLVGYEGSRWHWQLGRLVKECVPDAW